jgi:hypothetical protein
MDDAELQYQSHRTQLIQEVDSELVVPTSLTSDPRHLLCFHFVRYTKEVRNLINRPVVNLLDTRVPNKLFIRNR